MGTVSRAEYLKKYTTDSSEKPETKKSTNLLECQETSQSYEQGRDAETRKRVTGFNRGRKGKREEENSEEKKAREAKQAEMEKKYSATLQLIQSLTHLTLNSSTRPKTLNSSNPQLI
ncbi:unnamed protein product [Meloidogyne enterolobii]|uniref:Uncharacterized protein n=1 Tax=Meloidogyne enterolobii TaxID=390850 RepID=A0ACB1A0W9_MELEN